MPHWLGGLDDDHGRSEPAKIGALEARQARRLQHRFLEEIDGAHRMVRQNRGERITGAPRAPDIGRVAAQIAVARSSTASNSAMRSAIGSALMPDQARRKIRGSHCRQLGRGRRRRNRDVEAGQCVPKTPEQQHVLKALRKRHERHRRSLSGDHLRQDYLGERSGSDFFP